MDSFFGIVIFIIIVSVIDIIGEEFDNKNRYKKRKY